MLCIIIKLCFKTYWYCYLEPTANGSETHAHPPKKTKKKESTTNAYRMGQRMWVNFLGAAGAKSDEIGWIKHITNYNGMIFPEMKARVNTHTHHSIRSEWGSPKPCHLVRCGMYFVRKFLFYSLFTNIIHRIFVLCARPYYYMKLSCACCCLPYK